MTILYSVVVYYIFGEFEYFINKTTFCLLSAYTPWQKQSNRPVFYYNVWSTVLLWDVCGWLFGLISWKLTNVITNEWGILHVSAYTHTRLWCCWGFSFLNNECFHWCLQVNWGDCGSASGQCNWFSAPFIWFKVQIHRINTL